MRPKALDLFCGAGGAWMGLHRAGFDVVGVDIAPQPRYPFRFIEADALTFDLSSFDFIWASPVCKAFCKYKNARKNLETDYPNFIPETRARLEASGLPYIIENVPGAPLNRSIMLCGSSFGLHIRRHRYFESNTFLFALPCNHRWQKPQYPASSGRKPMSRCTVEVGSWDIPLETQARAMGIDWMRVEELSQAIPPAFSEFLGRQIISACFERAA